MIAKAKSSTESQAGDDAVTDSKVPVVKIPESGRVLGHLMEFCYPVSDPKLTALEDIRDVLGAATKYGITVAINSLVDNLQSFIPTQPLRVYAIACCNDLKNVGITAAKVAVEGSFLEGDCPELDLIPADLYWNLIDHYQKRKQPLRWRSVFALKIPRISHYGSFNKGDPDVDVIIESEDGRRFHLHKLMLSRSSTFFREMFTLPQGEHLGEGIPMPVIQVSESSDTLGLLFKLLYPLESGIGSPSFGVIYEALSAASKYEMNGVRFLIKEHLTPRVGTSPVAAFLIACRFGFREIALEAARQTLHNPILIQNSVVERAIDPRIDVPARLINRLIQFWSKYRAVIETHFEDKKLVDLIAPETPVPTTGWGQFGGYSTRGMDYSDCTTCESGKSNSTSTRSGTSTAPQTSPDRSMPVWMVSYFLGLKNAMMSGDEHGDIKNVAFDRALVGIMSCNSRCRDRAAFLIPALCRYRKNISKAVKEEMLKVRYLSLRIQSSLIRLSFISIRTVKHGF
jgi:hypothetical protein